MMAVKQGYGLPYTPQSYQLSAQFRQQGIAAEVPVLMPSTHGPLHNLLSKRLAGGKFNACQCAVAKRHEYRLAAMALAARASAKDKEDSEQSDSDKSDSDKAEDGKDDAKDDDEKSKEKLTKEKELKLPEELLGQAIKEVVMHEVGPFAWSASQF